MCRFLLPLFLCVSLNAQPIFVFTQPKAGTRFLKGSLTKYFEKQFNGKQFKDPHHTFRSGRCPEDLQKLIDSSRKEDIAIVGHYVLHPWRLELIRKNGCKVVVVARDPRQAIVSNVIHHTLHPKGGSGSYEEQERQIRRLNEKIKANVAFRWEKEIRQRVIQLAAWKTLSIKYPKTLKVLLFEDLKTNRYGFFIKLLRHFQVRKIDKPFLQECIQPKRGVSGYRNSNPSEWRTFVTEEMIAFANECIGDELARFYRFKL
ncbi:MAG: sulfotransferase domain-containing protein [Chlamydiales bacterium]|nr:sulfotransferase domain-containing protein [Chlamydiales bacterium]